MDSHPIAAPPVVLRELTLRQEAELTRHLALQLDAAETARLMDAIKFWLAFDVPDRIDDELVANMQQFDRERWGRIASLARDLHGQLTDSHPPLVDTNGIPFAEYDGFSSTLIGGGHHMKWLERLAQTAKAYSAAPKRRRGPRGLEWRDDLVALVVAHYPPGKIAVGEGSDFEQTIGLVLQYLGARLEPDVLHATIVRIRRRGVDPPFVIDG